jgi:two-component system, OmpR family, phosphate regulon sensor histidine kinase PhoR
MTNRSIRWVIGFGVVAIVAILAAQAYFFYQAFNLKERQTVQTLRICLQSVAENISRYNQSTLPDDIIHQYSPDYFIVDINNHIDSKVLEHYLRAELTRLHMDIDFEYAIYNCDNDQMVYGNYVSLNESEEQKSKLQNWPKYTEGSYYFGVHFPGMEKYILGELQLWYFFTAILVVVILFFGYSMMIILQQKKLSEVQRDFINNMSHEFRTPLTSISLSADVLEEEAGGGNLDRLRKYIAILKEQTRLMQNKVDKVLQQAETEHRFFKLIKEPVDLKDFLSDIRDEFHSRVEHVNGLLTLECQSTNAMILADKTHFSGVVINLLDNALKYNINPPDIRILVKELGNKYCIEVNDNGLGIEKRHLRRVFMPFFRVPSGNIHNVKGSGLGLSYVKKICDLHGWQVRVESEPGKGTAVKMTIPKLT